VFGDDHVMRYTGADDVAGGAGEAYIQRGVSLGKRLYDVFLFYGF